jgi:soluble lytic murein transglycosylase-like protein
MKVSLNLLYIKTLLLIVSLTASASIMANEVETPVSPEQNIETVTAPSTKAAFNPQESKWSLKNPNSMLVAMAFKFKNTEGSPQNYTEVVASYCSAAKSGDADAQYALGWMYDNGRGVSVDKSIAAQLYSMAAEQGHINAKESLDNIKDTLPKSNLPACLLPDPTTVVASGFADGAAQNERKAISDKTAALFYSQDRILKLVNKLAPRYEIDANLVMAFIAVESGFDVQATSPKNAKGLMQLIPETAKRFGVKDAYKAEDNIKGGLAYLQWLLAYFKGDVQLVAAAYNAGETTVEKYKGVPPYAETQMYVKKIASLYNNTTHPYKVNLVKASPMLILQNKRVM